MHLIKCKNEHIYDKDKFRSCPYCSKIRFQVRRPDVFGSGQKDVDTVMPEKNEQENYQQLAHRRVAGMLVCVAGEMMGEGFFLLEGDNALGRSSNMDIALTREITIARKKHATIHCDIDNERYTLSVNEEKSEVYCNGKVVQKQCALGMEDEIVIGKCHLKIITISNIWKA